MDIFFDFIRSVVLPVLCIVLALLALLHRPEWLDSFYGKAMMQIQDAISWLINTSIVSVDIAVHLLHWLGRVFVLLIFVGATLTFFDNILGTLDMSLLDPEGAFFKMTRLFGDRTTWVASTAIVATTVALGHFKTLDLNYEKHENEKRTKNSY